MGRWAKFFGQSAMLLHLGLFIAAGPLWAGPAIIRIAATGDIMLGTENLLPDDGAAGAFAEVKAYLKDRQVVIGNLEGPLTNRGRPSKEAVEGASYVFRSPPHYAERLKEAGFSIMSLANNHANDYGPEGQAQTKEVLDKAGILYTGGPGQWARQRVGKTTVSVLGLAPNKGCQNVNDIPAAVEMVKGEAAKADTLVVVSFHGGGEGGGHIYVPEGAEFFWGENRGDLRRLGRELIDAGAHLIIGHGPHVPRGLEIYKNRLIAYSLGNFVTGKGISISGYNGLAPLLLVELTAKGELAGGRVVSFKQNQAGRAELDNSNEAAKFMHALSLYDFEKPALGPDGLISGNETSALKLAASANWPPRPKARPRALAKAEGELPRLQPMAEVRPEAEAKSEKKRAKVPQTKAPTQYEWDTYSSLSPLAN